jgi:hypothetical protein
MRPIVWLLVAALLAIACEQDAVIFGGDASDDAPTDARPRADGGHD